jgi:hypothetical protein
VILTSESHGDSNQCTPYREKPDKYDTRIPRSVNKWSQTIHISCGQCIATFYESSKDLDGSHCFQEKGLPTQSTARRLIDPRVRIQFLSPYNQASVDDKLLGLLGTYHQHAIGTFKTCSREPTHWSLTDTGGGYSLEGAGFLYTTPRPSQPTVLPFPPKGPTGLQFNQVLSTKPKFEFKGTYGHHMVFRPLGHLLGPTTTPSHI